MTVKPPRVMMSKSQLTEPQLTALGCVVAESAYLERTVEVIISAFTGMNQQVRETVLAKAMIGAKIELMAELASRKLKSKVRRQRFAKIVTELKSCNNDRVTAVHSIWFTQPRRNGEQIAHALNPRGNVMLATTLESVAKRISAHHWDLFEFYRDVLKMRVVGRRKTKAASSASPPQGQ